MVTKETAAMRCEAAAESLSHLVTILSHLLYSTVLAPASVVSVRLSEGGGPIICPPSQYSHHFMLNSRGSQMLSQVSAPTKTRRSP